MLKGLNALLVPSAGKDPRKRKRSGVLGAKPLPNPKAVFAGGGGVLCSTQARRLAKPRGVAVGCTLPWGSETGKTNRGAKFDRHALWCTPPASQGLSRKNWIRRSAHLADYSKIHAE